MTELTRVESPAQIAELAHMAREIWTEHYTPIIGQAQVDYMLDMFQSERAIVAQLAGGCEYYVATCDGRGVGYLGLALTEDDHSLMISKLYVAKRARGYGHGSAMLEFAEGVCRERMLSVVWLTVNKNNTDSLAWYSRMGFTNAGPLVQDIGAGFVMDDYRLEKAVERTSQ